MKSLQRAALVAATGLLAVACTEKKPETKEAPAAAASKPAPAEKAAAELSVGELVGESGGIKVSKLAGSPKFPDAKIILKSPECNAKVPAKAKFEFEVEGYELGAQTVADPFLAASGKGQHIHFIVDNEPYAAYYEPSFEHELAPGSHIILAFLSRSYHESVKSMHVLTRVHVDEKTKKIENVSLDSAPHLFYSRPKGSYSGKGAQKLLLDFFLAGVEISKDGYKVEATLDGEKFLLTEWVPYVVEGLPMGEATVQLRLLDAEGKLVPGMFNDVTRTVKLSAE